MPFYIMEFTRQMLITTVEQIVVEADSDEHAVEQYEDESYRVYQEEEEVDVADVSESRKIIAVTENYPHPVTDVIDFE